jgi:hypothetical protein
MLDFVLTYVLFFAYFLRLMVLSLKGFYLPEILNFPC